MIGKGLQTVALLSDETVTEFLDKLSTIDETLQRAQTSSFGELPVPLEKVCELCGIPRTTFDQYRRKVRQDGRPVVRTYKFGKQVLIYPSELREDLRLGIHPDACKNG